MGGRNKRKAKQQKEEEDDEEKGSNEEIENEEDKDPYLSKPWSGTGVLESMPKSRDIKISKFSVALHGQELVKDTSLELNHGRRYGLIGLNGSGKSTMLRVIGERQVPIPEHIDIFYLTGEVPASEMTALESVLENVDKEVERLEKEAEDLAAENDDEVAERLQEIYARLDDLDVETAPARAGRILHGLGFDKEMQNKKTKHFSGGWRMRIALAKALFVSPSMLLLDEPTNHLDLEACVWLEEYLKSYNRILIVISHSQDFLNGICTNIIHLQKQILTYYTGNFDQFIETRHNLEENQMKAYTREQGEIQNIKNFVAKYGHGSAKLARQAKSREKVLSKMVERGLTEAVHVDRVLRLKFEPAGTIPPPVLVFHDVSFGYKPGKQNELYRNLSIGVDLDSRVALVGPNGAGKSTLLKLMVGEIQPTEGMVRAHQHLKIARYHQHLQDQLDVNLSPLEYMIKCWPEYKTKPEQMRQQLGRFGVTGKTQTLPIKNLSDGQKSRVVLSWIAFQNPHMLLLDEPTNHLDIETIDSLADAIRNWDGGMVLVSHDFRLISQVAKEIWECKNSTIERWEGDIMSYKTKLRASVLKEFAL